MDDIASYTLPSYEKVTWYEHQGTDFVNALIHFGCVSSIR